MVQSVKLRNRQLKKRTQALENKVHGIKQLGVDVVLVLKFPGKESGYSYVSSEEFLDRIMQIVSIPGSPKCISLTGASSDRMPRPSISSQAM